MARATKKRKTSQGPQHEAEKEQSIATTGIVALSDASVLMPDVSGILQTVDELREQFEQLKNAQIGYPDDGDAESFYDGFELNGWTRDEIKAYNAIAPVGQRLEDVMSESEDVQDEAIASGAYRPSNDGAVKVLLQPEALHNGQIRKESQKKSGTRERDKGRQDVVEKSQKDDVHPAHNEKKRRSKRNRTVKAEAHGPMQRESKKEQDFHLPMKQGLSSLLRHQLPKILHTNHFRLLRI